MPPRKQPITLFKLCVKSCVSLIHSTCEEIEKKNTSHEMSEQMALSVKQLLITILPAR